MTSLTVATLLVMLYGAANPRGYGRALALGGATAAGAAVALGGIAVPTFYAVGLGAALALAIELLGSGRRPTAHRRQLPPGVPLLVAFLAWGALVTVLSPVLFSGTSVATPKGQGELLAGYLTPSNVAQVGYLALGVCIVLFIARSPYSRPQLLGLSVCTIMVLSFGRYLHTEAGLPFPEGIFDNSPTLAFIETAPGGEERFRGTLSEPSSLGASCIVAIGYSLSRAGLVRGWRRVGLLGVAAAAAFMGAISTSATFVVACVIMALIAALTLGLGFLLRRVSISTATAVALCAAFVAALWILPQVSIAVEGTIDDKVGSASYDERSGADSMSYTTFLDTYGVGAGLGSNRASSFLPGLLSTSGIIGTLLFAFAVATLIARTVSIPDCRPVIWALVSLLAVKVVAGPDLSDPTGVLWLSLGLLSRAASPPPPRHEESLFGSGDRLTRPALAGQRPNGRT